MGAFVTMYREPVCTDGEEECGRCAREAHPRALAVAEGKGSFPGSIPWSYQLLILPSGCPWSARDLPFAQGNLYGFSLEPYGPWLRNFLVEHHKVK